MMSVLTTCEESIAKLSREVSGSPPERQRLRRSFILLRTVTACVTAVKKSNCHNMILMKQLYPILLLQVIGKSRKNGNNVKRVNGLCVLCMFRDFWCLPNNCLDFADLRVSVVFWTTHRQ
jgi:hypothetical protein